MGLARLRGDGSRSERSRLWKSLSGWAGWGATSQQKSSVRRKTEAASMASLGLWSSYLAASLSPLLRVWWGPFISKQAFCHPALKCACEEAASEA